MGFSRSQQRFSETLFLLIFALCRPRIPMHSLRLRDFDNSDPRGFSQRDSSRSLGVLSSLDAHLAELQWRETIETGKLTVTVSFTCLWDTRITEKTGKCKHNCTTRIWINFPSCYIHKCPMATKYIQITVTQKLRSPPNLQFSLIANFSLCCS